MILHIIQYLWVNLVWFHIYLIQYYYNLLIKNNKPGNQSWWICQIFSANFDYLRALTKAIQEACAGGYSNPWCLSSLVRRLKVINKDGSLHHPWIGSLIYNVDDWWVHFFQVILLLNRKGDAWYLISEYVWFRFTAFKWYLLIWNKLYYRSSKTCLVEGMPVVYEYKH